MKKVLSIGLVLVMMLSIFSVTAFAVPSEMLSWWDVYDDGVYYTVFDDGEASVTGYDEDHAKTNPDLVIPSQVEYDGSYYTVTWIDSDALATSEYKTITLPSTIYFVGDGAFAHCTKLQKVNIPSDCEFTYFSNQAFVGSAVEGDYYANEYTVIGKNVLFSFTGDGEFVIPENITFIADECFMMSGIEKVVFNNNIAEIPTSAFANCTELSEVIFSNSVEYIGSHAFENCKKLENVVFSDSVSVVDYNSFSNSGLKTLYLGRHASDIAGAFQNCKNFESVTISPSNTIYKTDGKAIYENAEFFDVDENGNFHTVECRMLAYYFPAKAQGNIVLPNDIKGISAYAFQGCNKLDSVKAPGIEFVDNFAFKDSSIKSFSTETYYSVYIGAFQNCKNLTDINIENIYYIDDGSFQNCESLVDVEISEWIYYVGGQAFANTGIKEITIGGEDCYVAEGAFQNCADLETVILADGVSEVGMNAFLGCPNLKRIHISKTVEYFEDNAFNGCENVTFEVFKRSAGYKEIKALGYNFEVVGSVSIWEIIINFFRSIFG